MKFIPNTHIADISPYQAGKPMEEVKRELNIDSVIKLASNENPLGCSPLAAKAAAERLSCMNRYPEASAFELTHALADKYKVRTENIVHGNGSDDIISLLAHGFLNPGDEAVMPEPSFLMYEIGVKTAKGTPVKVPLKDYAMDLEAMLKQVGPRTKMLFITNPFNPTGTVVYRNDFMEFCKKLPENILIIVDEAYIEFARDSEIYDSLAEPLQDPRIVTLRTFSKAYGLAGFRVGYAIMDEQIAEILHKIRQPFNVNSLAQAAGAAALKDEDFLQQTLSVTHSGIDFFSREFGQMGLEHLPSQANFIMVNMNQDSTRIFQGMLEKGVIVRSMKSYGFDTFLRITIGTKEENERCVSVLKGILNREKTK